MASQRDSGREDGKRGRNARGKGAFGDHNSSIHANGEMNEHLSERFKGGKQHSKTQATLTSSFDNGLDLTLNTDIREYVQKQQQITKSSDRDAWLAEPEIPTTEELSAAEAALVPNKIEGPFKNREKYLRMHYALLREDALGCLRDAIQDFRADPTVGETAKFSVYNQVYIVGYTFARRGLAARVKFSTSRVGKRISWSSSKRLVSGTLVALVPVKDKPGDLSNMLVAVIAARPLAGVLCEPPEIDIYFGRPEESQIDPQREWLMIEAKQGYFEAYRHTLTALQKLSQEAFPLADEICNLSQAGEPPAYIQASPILDLSMAASPAQKKDYANVDVTGAWPAAPADSLDDTQWEALKEIITKRLAIVQGPPGTGKTFVSKVALEILRAKKKAEDPPIIIAAQTNHALDQLLSHVSRFEPNYVRLGGRSTNPEVKKRALFEIRQSERIRPVPGGLLGKSNNLLTKQANAMTEILNPFFMPGTDAFSTDQVSGPKVLEGLGVLTPEQAKSLEDGASQWVSASNTPHGPLELWLDQALIPFDVKFAKDTYGFDEIEDNDLEFEQLRENEDSTGINDNEEIELLKGPWVPLRERFTVQTPSPVDFERASRYLDTVSDLWKISSYFRGPMYFVMQTRAKAAMVKKFRESAIIYDRLVKDSLVGKWEQDAIYLQRASIIGMTTTGFSKYRPLISALKPKIMLIEEAAEVLEAPVTVACMESLEHLILVGDHQQLQGHCSVQELEGEPFHLNVSLFERLVRNDMPYKTLLRQRRMNPEFRRLIADLYPRLSDHPSVLDRPVEPWGMGNIKSFFFDHDWSEYKDQSLSTYNEEEAKFIARFYRHLWKNGVDPTRITVLTFYNGQRKCILKELKAFPEIQGYVNVKTVDSYQGEENDIVLLSLVRNVEGGKIGFLSNENRICVALSRAKHGFYLFGNARSMRNGSPLWYNVIMMMESQPKRLAEVLPTQCIKHRRTTLMRYPEDWNGTEGGCMQRCDTALACGHPCPLRCHAYTHEKIQCQEDCKKPLPCGHECAQKCSEQCSCSCDEFSSIRRAEEVKRRDHWGQSFPGDSSGQGSLDARNFQDSNNGQGFPLYGRPPYLPQQYPGSNNTLVSIQEGFSQRAQSTTDPGLRRPMLANVGYRVGGPWNPTPEETIKTHSLSPEKQGQLRQGWKSFAGGGVVADDQRLGAQAMSQGQFDMALHGPPPAQSVPGVRYDTGRSANPGPVKEETITILRDGRTRYLQKYRPEASRRFLGPEPTSSDQGQCNVRPPSCETFVPNVRSGNALPANDSTRGPQSHKAAVPDDRSSVAHGNTSSQSQSRAGSERKADSTHMGEMRDLDLLFRGD